MTSERSRHIRHAVTEDAATIAQLNQHVHVLHVEAEPDDFSELSPPDAVDFFESLLKDEANVLLLSVTAEGRAVGYAWAHDSQRSANPFTKPARTLYIHHVAVDPSVRGHGIGTALVTAIEDEARDRGVSRIALDHWAFNESAQRFFAALGFEPYNIRMRRHLAPETTDVR